MYNIAIGQSMYYPTLLYINYPPTPTAPHTYG